MVELTVFLITVNRQNTDSLKILLAYYVVNKNVLSPASDRHVFLFPQKNRGKNFGSKSGFDLPMSGCAKPLALESMKDLEICLAANETRIPFSKNGEKALDFRREFTISAWVKVDWSRYAFSYIVGTYGDHDKAPRFMFRNPAKRIPTSLLFGFGQNWSKIAYTTQDNTDLHTWRHVAVVFKPPHDIKFYRNAKEWPLEQKLGADFDFVEPTEFLMFKWLEGFVGFTAIVQKVLSESEIGKLMYNLYI